MKNEETDYLVCWQICLHDTYRFPVCQVKYLDQGTLVCNSMIQTAI
jgi:hypothetical protein